MACSLVTAGEICPRATGRESKASGVCDALLVYGLHYSQRKTDPENALTIAGADRFIRRGGTCPLHAIFMNQPCIIWGELGMFASQTRPRQSSNMPSGESSVTALAFVQTRRL